MGTLSLLDDDPMKRAERYVRRRFDGATVAPLVGDASNRAYYRVVLDGGQSRVLALLPEAFDPETLPFLNVHELLRAIPVRVPQVFDVSGELGILLLEDLGDTLLQDAVEAADDARKKALYREALDLLARIQTRGAEIASDRYLPFRIAFDEEKFEAELQFFREHFLEGLRGAVLTADERLELDEAFKTIASGLCRQPFVLCHRDFHARNLMLESGELVLIDFQDARRGPRAYDLVSLLNDSYVGHDPGLVREMTAYFENAVGEEVAGEYDLAALQRNLKALGTFGFQIARRKNTVYERYLGRTLELVRANIERHSQGPKDLEGPAWDALRRILARHCEELGS